MDANDLCDALHEAIRKQEHSVQVGGIMHELGQMKLKLTKEDDGLILDYIQYLRNCNILRWGLNTYSTNSEPPFMHLTKYGEYVFSKDAALISIKESFLELYNAK